MFVNTKAANEHSPKYLGLYDDEKIYMSDLLLAFLIGNYLPFLAAHVYTSINRRMNKHYFENVSRQRSNVAK